MGSDPAAVRWLARHVPTARAAQPLCTATEQRQTNSEKQTEAGRADTQTTKLLASDNIENFLIGEETHPAFSCASRHGPTARATVNANEKTPPFRYT